MPPTVIPINQIHNTIQAVCLTYDLISNHDRQISSRMPNPYQIYCSIRISCVSFCPGIPQSSTLSAFKWSPHTDDSLLFIYLLEHQQEQPVVPARTPSLVGVLFPPFFTLTVNWDSSAVIALPLEVMISPTLHLDKPVQGLLGVFHPSHLLTSQVSSVRLLHSAKFIVLSCITTTVVALFVDIINKKGKLHVFWHKERHRGTPAPLRCGEEPNGSEPETSIIWSHCSSVCGSTSQKEYCGSARAPRMMA